MFEDCEYVPQFEQAFHTRNLPQIFKTVQPHDKCPQLETQDKRPDHGTTASLQISNLETLKILLQKFFDRAIVPWLSSKIFTGVY